ncbi:uncharacterized protein LOC128198386 [Bicyclus anynana]|uniref:Uncharacterized protein LOC128198386 n=1 Tax=Bicyclus anynana TaxID=110368 RepID=A0ABM3LKI5_BICAN|nr:uncharacterized protein LOC128198386 [Bicyclus anynana]
MALTTEQFQKLLDQNYMQQQALIAALTRQKGGNMTKCKSFFDGEKETEKVESFLSAITLFKNLEGISDEDFIQGLPLVLRGEAGIWWQGVKNEIATVADFESRLREKFSPLKLPHLLYQELMSITQGTLESTENFITKKRMLFSLLPEPKHCERQQIDMIYHLLRLDIRDKAPRTSFTTYNQLIETAKGIEQINNERKISHPNAPYVQHSKIRCSFCKNPGHSVSECRKKKKIESRAEQSQTSKYGQAQTQAPSPSQPKFSCYGCGAPNVVRTNCPTCCQKTIKPIIKKEEIGFCSLSIRHETKPRPVIPATIGGIKGFPYVDTCAKTNIASYSLYCRLLEQGYGFKEEKVELTLADGVSRCCKVLTVRVDVEVYDRVFPTTFMILPESRKNKTLLGIGFLTTAMMVLNLPQFTWHFVDNPDDVHELFTEDFVKFKNEEFASRHAAIPSTICAPVNAVTWSSNASTLSSDTESLVSVPDPKNEASLPHKTEQMNRKYELREINFGTPKRVKTLFDGYSPRLNYMYRDAQINIQMQDVELSPNSLALFPDVGINTVDIDLPSDIELSPDHQNQLKNLLSTFEDVFTPNSEPAKYAQHAINTAEHGPISVPPYRLSPPRRERFETIAIDLFGPLPSAPDGKAWILIVQDNATRWVELFALESATAEACAETLLNEVILRYGLPRRLTSDNGSQFVSAVMQKLCFCLGIKHTFTPIYHPQANPVERRNRDLKTQLGILVEGNHSSWPEKLPSIRFAMNTSVCTSTEKTPAYLTFGRELRTTDDIQHDFRQIVESENFIAEITPKLKSLAYTIKKAREVQEMKEEARKEYFDKQRRQSPRYKANDLVLANIHPISKASKGYSSKLTPRRDGPYMIVAQVGPASYKLANIDDPDTVIGTYHASSLKPYIGSREELPAPVQPLRKRGRPRKNK